jgi:type II secretion system protein G
MRKFREMIFSGGNKGFTLIELLVVIAVLGILAGIAVPRMTGISDEAKNARAEADLRTAQTGVEMYFAANESYPSNLSAVDNYVDTGDIETVLVYNQTGSGSGYTLSAEGATTTYSISVN